MPKAKTTKALLADAASLVVFAFPWLLLALLVVSPKGDLLFHIQLPLHSSATPSSSKTCQAPKQRNSLTHKNIRVAYELGPNRYTELRKTRRESQTAST
jgi:hypothetical protein